MSEVFKGRKPDRKFYRHPKYDDPRNGYQDWAAVDLPSDQAKGETRRGRGRGLYNRESSRRLYWSQSNSRDYELSRRFQSQRNSAARPVKSEHLLVVPDAIESDETCSTSTKNIPSSAERSVNQQDVRHDAASVKHGGLIHLPKDVHIYDHSEDLRPGTSRQTKRGNQPSSNKPVVVVRPSFPQVRRNSESESGTHTDSKRELLKSNTKENTSTSHMACTGNAQLPVAPQVPWTDATEAAFQYFLHSFTHLDSDAGKRGITPDSINVPVGEFPDEVPSNRSPRIQIPNEKIAQTIQQIVQLDGVLSSLLVTPGVCARVVSSIQPSLHSKGDKDYSQAELVIARWWAAVQQLRERLFDLFEFVILADLDFCNTAHVEQGMWKSVFYTILELLRSWINNPNETGLLATKQSTVAQSVPEERSRLVNLLQHICLNDVVSAGELRLCDLLERIQTVNRVQLAQLLSDGRPPPETRSRTRRLVYLSAQKLMLFLGDLARYREVLVGERNFGKARSWYQKAQLLVPKNGRSYNQLAVLAIYTSRHLDAMHYYMRTLAASNPFPTASQSLSVLFNEIRPKAENLVRQLCLPKHEVANPHRAEFNASVGRFQRVEIWVHPLDGQTYVLQGSRRLVYVPLSSGSRTVNQRNTAKSVTKGVTETDDRIENDDEDDEDAQAELEEYANMSLIELNRQFGLTFIHAHGKLFTKIGMETFPEVASLALQALSGLLAQNPCPLSAERLCQLCIVNMYNVDRAMSLTAHANAVVSSKETQHSKVAIESGRDVTKLQPICRLGVETLRSVHHDHAARFALDTFSLLCRRTAQLLQQATPPDSAPWWLPPDARLLLPALRLWSEWMILHPEHWLPPPNHRDPTLRPCLNDCQLVADLCTRAANWLSRNPIRPHYDEVNPTTSLVLRHKGVSDPSADDEDKPTESAESEVNFNATFLFEEVMCAGFKPMLDLTPKMYRFSGQWSTDTVADYVRIDKLVLFGDFLCGIDSPVLTYDVDRAVYESVVEREASERKEDKQPDPVVSEGFFVKSQSSTDGDTMIAKQPNVDASTSEDILYSESSSDIAALQRQRAVLQRQLEEENRLATWRRNAVRQAASGGRRAIELEVRPIYLLPDTNCYIDWLAGIATLAQRSSNYTVLVPIIVVNELDALARPGPRGSSSWRNSNVWEGESEVSRSGLIQERARSAIAFLEHEFAHRNARLRALTARGSVLETIAFRNEINGGRDPGQTNDDVILTCCNHYCKGDPDRFRSGRCLDQTLSDDPTTQPMRIVREIVLLTSDRNLRLKALNINIPARPLRTFVTWSRLPLVTHLPTSTEPSLTKDTRENEPSKSQPRGQWRQPLRH